MKQSLNLSKVLWSRCCSSNQNPHYLNVSEEVTGGYKESNEGELQVLYALSYFNFNQIK
jgi:hypothetical protein